MSDYKHRCHLESEMTLCRCIFTVSIRDMVGSSTNSYSRRCRREAKQWFNNKDDGEFSFANVAIYLFGDDVDEEVLRKRLKKILKNKKVKGNRNILKILDGINEET